MLHLQLAWIYLTIKDVVVILCIARTSYDIHTGYAIETDKCCLYFINIFFLFKW